MIDSARPNMRRMPRRQQAERLVRKLAKLLGVPLQVKTSEIGRRFERQVARVCKSLGFQVIDASSHQLPWDLVVNGHRVQCKSRNAHGNRSYSVYLLKNSQKRYMVVDVDFFVVKFCEEVFVIPSREIAREDGTVMHCVSLARLQHYKDAWGQLAGESVYHERQQRLFQTRGEHGS